MSRRGMLGALGAGALGATAMAGCQGKPAAPAEDSALTPSPVAFHGEHQAGILTVPQRLLVLSAFDLRAGATKDDLRRLFSLWTDTAARLTAAAPALADTEPELALTPASLTVTVGVGERAVKVAGAQAPPWLKPLTAFPTIDRLQPRWNDGDVVLQLCGDDEMALAHAARMFTKDAAPFVRLRWQQRGWRSSPDGSLNRNLLGQVDGTINPEGDDAESLVWVGEEGPAWLRGGTSMVVRRIAMDLESWDRIDRPGREVTIGRDLATGAPLSGGNVSDAVDLDKVDPATGFPVIAKSAHTRRALTGVAAQRIVRRPYNYDDDPFTPAGTPGRDEMSSSGLVFIAFQKDVTAQYLPIQRRLAEADLLNTWTFPIGSAVFAMLPGVQEGEIFGQVLVGA